MTAEKYKLMTSNSLPEWMIIGNIDGDSSLFQKWLKIIKIWEQQFCPQCPWAKNTELHQSIICRNIVCRILSWSLSDAIGKKTEFWHPKILHSNLSSTTFFSDLFPHLHYEDIKVHPMELLWASYELMHMKRSLWCLLVEFSVIVDCRPGPWDTYSHKELLHSWLLWVGLSLQTHSFLAVQDLTTKLTVLFWNAPEQFSTLHTSPLCQGCHVKDHI